MANVEHSKLIFRWDEKQDGEGNPIMNGDDKKIWRIRYMYGETAVLSMRVWTTLLYLNRPCIMCGAVVDNTSHKNMLRVKFITPLFTLEGRPPSAPTHTPGGNPRYAVTTVGALLMGKKELLRIRAYPACNIATECYASCSQEVFVEDDMGDAHTNGGYKYKYEPISNIRGEDEDPKKCINRFAMMFHKSALFRHELPPNVRMPPRRTKKMGAAIKRAGEKEKGGRHAGVDHRGSKGSTTKKGKRKQDKNKNKKKMDAGESETTLEGNEEADAQEGSPACENEPGPSIDPEVENPGATEKVDEEEKKGEDETPKGAEPSEDKEPEKERKRRGRPPKAEQRQCGEDAGEGEAAKQKKNDKKKKKKQTKKKATKKDTDKKKKKRDRGRAKGKHKKSNQRDSAKADIKRKRKSTEDEEAEKEESSENHAPPPKRRKGKSVEDEEVGGGDDDDAVVTMEDGEKESSSPKRSHGADADGGDATAKKRNISEDAEGTLSALMTAASNEYAKLEEKKGDAQPTPGSVMSDAAKMIRDAIPSIDESSVQKEASARATEAPPRQPISGDDIEAIHTEDRGLGDQPQPQEKGAQRLEANLMSEEEDATSVVSQLVNLYGKETILGIAGAYNEMELLGAKFTLAASMRSLTEAVQRGNYGCDVIDGISKSIDGLREGLIKGSMAKNVGGSGAKGGSAACDSADAGSH
jgi:hypothetical protein